MPNLDKQIRVSVIKAPLISTPESEQSGPLSIYIYIAGLLVSLSGMYAATYDMLDTNFGLILRTLIICGYCVSYWLRRNKIDLKQYQVPLLVVFATVMYFVASTAPELGSSTASNGMARPYQIQVVIIWIAVLQSFTLFTDSAILFACVPSMALIGIMSSGTPDTEVQYAFVVFLAATTFLMVHENHLRARTAMALRSRSSIGVENWIFRGEMMLVGCCVLGTMLIATVIASPIAIVGKALIPMNSQDGNKAIQNAQAAAGANVQIDEPNSVDIGTGPRTETDVALLAVRSSKPISYLRGITRDYYNGRAFVNQLPEGESRQATASPPPSGGLNTRQPNRFDFNPYTSEVGTGRMDGAIEVSEDITVVGGTTRQFYVVPSVTRVHTDFESLKASINGSITTSTPMVQGQEYRIASLMPSSDPELLMRSGTDYPASVTSTYLQVKNVFSDHNERLQGFADECTRGKANPYEKVTAIRDALASRCKYNLQAPAIASGRDVVEAFLFDAKEGYCDSFAAALTMLCRYAHVPARYASGFTQGDRQNDGTYSIRTKDKHAWTEVYFTNIGWVPFEATAGTVDTTPSGSTATSAVVTPLRWLLSHGAGPPAIALLILILIGYVIRTELLNRFKGSRISAPEFETLPASNMEIVQLYQKACSELARSGLSRPLHLTPSEFNVDISGRMPPSSEVGAMLDTLTRLHQTFAYGRGAASDADVYAAREALKGLKAAIPRLPRTVVSNQRTAS